VTAVILVPETPPLVARSNRGTVSCCMAKYKVGSLLGGMLPMGTKGGDEEGGRRRPQGGSACWGNRVGDDLGQAMTAQLIDEISHTA
jgi:hypothetical protein